MKISERVIRIGLIAMIGLSLYLSYMIWMSPAGRDNLMDNETSDMTMNIQNYKPLSDIFLPLHLIWVDEDGTKETNAENVIKEVQTKVSEANFHNFTYKEYPSEELMKKAEQMKHGIELSYDGQFSLGDYVDTYQLNISGLPKEEMNKIYFSRIEFDFQTGKIAFFDYQKNAVTEGDIEWHIQSIESILADSEREWTIMNPAPELIYQQYFTEDVVRLKKYSYYASTQSQNLFREAFFTNPKEVKINDDSQDILYYNAGENMTILMDDQIVKFENTMTDKEIGEELYKQSANYVSHLGNNFGSIRFFDRRDNQLDYRVFVEGFPVFSGGSQGLIRFNFSDSNQIGTREMTINASLNSIQVPIPSETVVELPSSSSVKEELLEAGAQEQRLQMIIVGYQWVDVKGGFLVDLTPTWYVKYEDKWVNYQSLLSTLKETEEEKHGF